MGPPFPSGEGSALIVTPHPPDVMAVGVAPFPTVLLGSRRPLLRGG